MTARRDLLALPALLVLPLAASGAKAPVRIGAITHTREILQTPSAHANPFLDGMKENGLLEGRDFVMEWRYETDIGPSMPAVVKQLIDARVDLILVMTTRAAREAQRQTSSIPIVFMMIPDPVGTGLVTSLAHPGANLTGTSSGADLLIAKQIDLMAAMVPQMRRLGLLYSPINKGSDIVRDMQAVVQRLGVAATPVLAATRAQVATAFDTLQRERVQAVLVFDDEFFYQHRHYLAELAIKARLPIAARGISFAEAGFLFRYGPVIVNAMARIANYVARILGGARPADLPVEQPVRFALTINRRTARAIGMPLSQEMLLRADDVIE